MLSHPAFLNYTACNNHYITILCSHFLASCWPTIASENQFLSLENTLGLFQTHESLDALTPMWLIYKKWQIHGRRGIIYSYTNEYYLKASPTNVWSFVWLHCTLCPSHALDCCWCNSSNTRASRFFVMPILIMGIMMDWVLIPSWVCTCTTNIQWWKNMKQGLCDGLKISSNCECFFLASVAIMWINGCNYG